MKLIDKCYVFLQKRWYQKGQLFYYRIIKLWLNLFYLLYAKFTPRCGLDPKANFVVSLTSFPARIDKVHLVVETLLRQRDPPRIIMLCLAEEQFPGRVIPKRLQRLQQQGLTIRWCNENLRSHKKYYYAMREFLNLTVITADDDMFYPESWTKTLLEAAARNPDTVVCFEAARVLYQANGELLPYNSWENVACVERPRMDLIPIGAGGVLYPAGSLDKDVFDKSFFMTACRNADDLWLRTMSLKAEKKVVLATNRKVPFVTLFAAKKEALNVGNVDKGQNDIQLKNIFTRYRKVWDIAKLKQ